MKIIKHYSKSDAIARAMSARAMANFSRPLATIPGFSEYIAGRYACARRWVALARSATGK